MYKIYFTLPTINQNLQESLRTEWGHLATVNEFLTKSSAEDIDAMRRQISKEAIVWYYQKQLLENLSLIKIFANKMDGFSQIEEKFNSLRENFQFLFKKYEVMEIERYICFLHNFYWSLDGKQIFPENREWDQELMGQVADVNFYLFYLKF